MLLRMIEGKLFPLFLAKKCPYSDLQMSLFTSLNLQSTKKGKDVFNNIIENASGQGAEFKSRSRNSVFGSLILQLPPLIDNDRGNGSSDRGNGS